MLLCYASDIPKFRALMRLERKKCNIIGALDHRMFDRKPVFLCNLAFCVKRHRDCAVVAPQGAENRGIAQKTAVQRYSAIAFRRTLGSYSLKDVVGGLG